MHRTTGSIARPRFGEVKGELFDYIECSITTDGDASVTSGITNAGGACIRALLFDVFGTVVDWRTSVANQVEELARRKGVTVDGAASADEWRAQYAPSMDRVRTGDVNSSGT